MKTIEIRNKKGGYALINVESIVLVVENGNDVKITLSSTKSISADGGDNLISVSECVFTDEPMDNIRLKLDAVGKGIAMGSTT